MAGNIFTRTTNKIIGSSNKANIVFDSTWKYSNDGINYYDIGSGGTGGSHTVVVDNYADLPTTGENGTYGFVRNSLTGVFYICISNEWLPVYNCIVGNNKATLDIFANDIGNLNKSIVEKSLKLQALDVDSLCGVSNYIDQTIQHITTSVNLCLPPIVDGSSFEVLGGIFLKKGTKISSLMTGFSSGYDCRIIKHQNWNYVEGQSYLDSEWVAPCPTVGNDFNILKLVTYNNHLGLFNFYRSYTSGPVQDYNGFLVVRDNVDFTEFLGSAPNEFGFCMYSDVANASACFINNYADDGNFYNQTMQTGFVYVAPPPPPPPGPVEISSTTWNLSSIHFYITVENTEEYIIDWGDGASSNVIGTGSSQDNYHLYSAPYSTRQIIVYVNNPDDLLEITLTGMGGPCPDFATATSLERITFQTPNLATGSIPNFPNNVKYLTIGGIANAGFTGTFPTLPTSLISATFSRLPNVSGAPNISSCSNLEDFTISSCPLLSISSLSNTNVKTISISSSTSGGAIPDISGCSSLTGFVGFNNNSTSFTGSIPSSCTSYNVSTNLLNQTNVDAILAHVASSLGSRPTSGSLNLTGNAIPSAAGLANKALIQAHGWSVAVSS